MNYSITVVTLLAFAFFIPVHSAQVTVCKTELKIEPIEFDIDEYLFVIHPQAIHIYNKFDINLP